jgi:hypothetical protein
MNSRVTSIYITALFLAVNAQNTVLPVFEMERNMFYRHKAALMYDQVSTAAVWIVYTIARLSSSRFSTCLFRISVQSTWLSFSVKFLLLLSHPWYFAVSGTSQLDL